MCPFQSVFEEWREKRSYCKLVMSPVYGQFFRWKYITWIYVCQCVYLKKKKQKITDQFVPILSPQTNQVTHLAVWSNSLLVDPGYPHSCGFDCQKAFAPAHPPRHQHTPMTLIYPAGQYLLPHHTAAQKQLHCSRYKSVWETRALPKKTQWSAAGINGDYLDVQNGRVALRCPRMNRWQLRLKWSFFYWWAGVLASVFGPGVKTSFRVWWWLADDLTFSALSVPWMFTSRSVTVCFIWL